MTARVIMIQGTGSNVGKSLICAGLCRLFADAGLKVAPFKPQNMSNNAAVTADGGEIGRAQALQARAARIEPVADMNPILLKPESERGAQVIVQGRKRETLSARAYFRRRQDFLPKVCESFLRLVDAHDLVIVEGAGSPAEINLRKGDIANMGFARSFDIPVVLVADIHRGGVIATLIGTLAVLPPADADLIKAFIINNFHGDPDLFSEGRSFLERHMQRPCLGILPHVKAARLLPAEDALALDPAGSAKSEASDETGQAGPGKTVRIAVPRLQRIANFDDLDPLLSEPDVDVRILQPGDALPGDTDLVFIPGSKAVRADLAFLREQGWDIDILAHVRRGGYVLGVCGGYQMLGETIHDPHGLEGPPGESAGLGLLAVHTVLSQEKTTRRVEATHAATGTPILAYEIHLGRSTGADCARPFAHLNTGEPDGAVSADGRIMGTYLHGAFTSDAFRRAFLSRLGARSFASGFEERVDEALNTLAAALKEHLDIETLISLARKPAA
ncbi:cobyric acid synthase [Thermopetrobacter sp. TC1]|uniref:cobyric acid synthase n=1 Tax=Thermopetrobacter sp. TC1 TaxID=1495045 RepID=UPI000AA2FA73|nr:cobyric acid synthase [Thermopetrobacter sp. TC1]